MTDKAEATKAEATKAISILREYIPTSELQAIADGCRSEEMQFFFNKLVELVNTIKTMPRTYEQDGKSEKAIAYLHYFKGGADWYITELDKGSEEDKSQSQAFGLADLGYGAELGYISIVELVEAGVELDLYFSPKTLRELKTEKQEA